ncbi:MAG: S41 family peptidase [Candidatus Aminicenantia bacterium]
MFRKKITIYLLLFLYLSIFVFPQSTPEENDWTPYLKKLSAVFAIIEDNYYQEVDSEKLIYAAIRGLLSTLDPHSHFLDPDLWASMREEQRGKFYGLGIQIQKLEDRLTVISPIEGTPAYRLGIQAGDIITHINGESTKEMSGVEAVRKLRGPKGTKVNITIYREGLEKPIQLTITRQKIPLHSVPYSFMLNQKTGYIFIRNFAQTTTREFEQAMEKLTEQGMEKLILDLRYNSGGSLFQSINIADEFLEKGKLIVSTKGRNPSYNQSFFALEDSQYEDLPLIILINKGSASASEIVAGAMKDHGRALIVGENSWGKGVVQTVFSLTRNTALALTTSKYYTPSGRCIQRDYSLLEDYYLMYQHAPSGKQGESPPIGDKKDYPQGGILPDFKVKLTLSPVVIELLNKGAFFSYARKFVSHLTPLSKKYEIVKSEKDRKKLTHGELILDYHFKVNEEMINDFKTFLIASKIRFDENKFDQATEEIRREITREIFAAIWGIKEGVRIYRKNDPVVIKALELFSKGTALVAKGRETMR